MERAIRKGAIAFRRWTARDGWTRQKAAESLGIATSTLAGWEREWAEDRMKALSLGRPPDIVDQPTRARIMTAFQIYGPDVSVATLMAEVPEAGRRELEDLAVRYRRLFKRSLPSPHVLRWLVPGAVWATDYIEELPGRIDGRYRYILVVRDLASGEMLLALPTLSKSAETVVAALETIFKQYGPPLVLKADNSFYAGVLDKLFQDYGVIPLLSPPGCPRYNGACEAGIGGLQAAIHIEAARFDRPGEWTCDDVEKARLVANAEHHPWGLAQPTPDQAWASRSPLTEELRQALAASVQQLIPQARLELKLDPNIPWDQLDRWKQGAVLREAVRRALVVHGILRIRRMRFTQPLPVKKVADIT
jgi:transposase InsO family protein